MTQTEYAVFYLDEEGQEFQAGLDMCRGELRCPECAAHPEHMDVCDFQHGWVTDKTIAEDRCKELRREGYEARIWQRRK
jgi:hypothetical protein